MGQRIHQSFSELENLIGVTKGGAAGVAKHQAAALAVEQCLAELLLQ